MSHSRYPVDVKGVGLVQHGRQKTFMFSVFWSDRNDILIYRTFDDFKNLTRQLEKKFPLEAGLVKRSERILPILKDAPLLFLSSPTSIRFIERLRLLESYSQTLLQTDPKISQCEDVLQFYAPKNQDLTPSFPENSVVIMPSERDGGRGEAAGGVRPRQPVTQPILSESYLCIESFETKDTKNRPFRVKKNEHIDVLMRDNTGWWLVENNEKCLAWFPAPYLVRADAAKTICEQQSERKGTSYFAAKGYEAQSPDELSVAVGVVVEVLEPSDNGWWRIWYNGRTGYVPSMFLQPYRNPHQKLQVVLDQDKFGSTPNLHKAVSSLDVNREPATKEKPGNSEAENREVRLDRRKSRSLSGLTVRAEPPVMVPTMLQPTRLSGSYVEWDGPLNENWKPSPLARKVHEAKTVLESEESSSWSRKGARRRTDSRGGQQRKDSGFDEGSSFSGSNLSVSSADADFNTTPMVPPRPSTQEILARCTTMTREAAQISFQHLDA